MTEGAGGLDSLGHARRVVRRGTHAVLAGGTEAPLSPYALTCYGASGRLTAAENPQGRVQAVRHRRRRVRPGRGRGGSGRRGSGGGPAPGRSADLRRDRRLCRDARRPSPQRTGDRSAAVRPSDAARARRCRGGRRRGRPGVGRRRRAAHPGTWYRAISRCSRRWPFLSSWAPATKMRSGPLGRSGPLVRTARRRSSAAELRSRKRENSSWGSKSSSGMRGSWAGSWYSSSAVGGTGTGCCDGRERAAL